MAGMEDIIPEDSQLNAYIYEDRAALREAFGALINENGILDPDLELQYLSFDDRMMRFSRAFGGKLLEEGDVLERAQEVAYRGAMFAYQVVREITGSAPERVSGEYLAERGVSGKALVEAIHQDIANYLARRPHVRALIEEYLLELDTTTKYTEYARLSAAFTFMVIEKREAEKYLAAQVETVTMERATEKEE